MPPPGISNVLFSAKYAFLAFFEPFWTSMTVLLWCTPFCPLDALSSFCPLWEELLSISQKIASGTILISSRNDCKFIVKSRKSTISVSSNIEKQMISAKCRDWCFADLLGNCLNRAVAEFSRFMCVISYLMVNRCEIWLIFTLRMNR